MWTLFLAWMAGAALRFLFAWAFEQAFTLKSSLKMIVVTVVIGVPIAYGIHHLNVDGWIIYVVMAAGGFLSQYAVEWLNKQRN